MAFGVPLLQRVKKSILDYGAVGGGQIGYAATNDAAIQNAVAAVAAAGGGSVVIPFDRFYTSATFTLLLPANVSLEGDGVGPFDVVSNRKGTTGLTDGDPIAYTQGPTIIIQNTSAGQALLSGNGTAVIACNGDQRIQDIIFAHPQPVPVNAGPTYVPTQYPWTISSNIQTGLWLGGLEVVRCMVYGAWQGVKFWGGRNRIVDTTIEAFLTGLKVDGTADVTYVSNVRLWPLHADVYGTGAQITTMNCSVYQIANLTAAQLLRCDEIQASGLFVQCANVGLDIPGDPNLANPGPFGKLVDSYIENCNICVRVTRTALNGIQFIGGGFIPTYTSPTQTNNTWLQVLATPVASGVVCYVLVSGVFVGSGPAGSSQTYLPDIQGATVGKIIIRDALGYNVGGPATGPGARTSQTNTLPASITLTTGIVVKCPQGNFVTYYISGPASNSVNVAIQNPSDAGIDTVVVPSVTVYGILPVRLGPGQFLQITTGGVNATAVPVGDY